MGMVVRTNTMAINAQRQLNMNNNRVSKSLEKLASGYEINRAGDDAAGLAISERMKAQIKDLDAASSNAQDGISLVQTAEGALNEVQYAQPYGRVGYESGERHLHREPTCHEVKQLQSEIDRIAYSTNFNSLKLRDGSLSSMGASSGTTTTKGASAITNIVTD